MMTLTRVVSSVALTGSSRSRRWMRCIITDSSFAYARFPPTMWDSTPATSPNSL